MATSSNGQVPGQSAEAARDALASLLISGALNGSVDSLEPAERGAARQRRRATAIRGCNALMAAVGGAQAFDAGPAAETTDDAAWLSARKQQEAVGREARAARDALSRAWLTEAIALLRAVASASDDRAQTIAKTLARSVVRPLAENLGASMGADHAAYVVRAGELMPVGAPKTMRPEEIETALVALAVATGSAAALNAAVGEAASALARLVQAGPLAHDETFAAMRAAALKEKPVVSVATDGPYVFAGAAQVVDHLGVPLDVPGLAAFCRCGQSATKPYCDGSHVALGFSGDKDARRIPDQRDTYVGVQATVFDNRGLCAHSGFCTDRLNTVFHVGQEPFVTPSGARLDDIMRAVRRCPSGALGFGIEGAEMRDYADEPRPPMVEISKDGPYRFTGGIALVDEAGHPVPRNAGASLEHYSLCRCGSSLNKPFCSGMHWEVNFADPRPPEDWEPTLFEWAGGYPALLDMTRIFYARHVPSDPLVGPLFAAMEADHPERVAAWLSEVFGGPKFYSERYGGYTRMISQHLDKHLTQAQRSHWATLMAQSADEAGLPNDAEFRAAFIGYIEWGSRIAVENSTGGAHPPPNMPVPRWWWVCNATPSARVSALAPVEAAPASTPSARVSALAPVEAAPAVADAPVLEEGETPSYAKHIKDLFRPKDRNSMKFAFDLWKYDDVRTHGEAILARLAAGTMPCDGAWPPEKLAVFRRWVEDGRPA